MDSHQGKDLFASLKLCAHFRLLLHLYNGKPRCTNDFVKVQNLRQRMMHGFDSSSLAEKQHANLHNLHEELLVLSNAIFASWKGVKASLAFHAFFLLEFA